MLNVSNNLWVFCDFIPFSLWSPSLSENVNDFESPTFHATAFNSFGNKNERPLLKEIELHQYRGPSFFFFLVFLIVRHQQFA